MHIRGSGVVGDCSDESGLSLDTTRVCLGPLGCHGYDSIPLLGPSPQGRGYRCPEADDPVGEMESPR